MALEAQACGPSLSVRQQCGRLSVGQRRQVPAVQSEQEALEAPRAQFLDEVVHMSVLVASTVQKHVEVPQLQSINKVVNIPVVAQRCSSWMKSFTCPLSLQRQMPIV